MKIGTLKTIFSLSLLASLLIPVISFAQSSDITASQVLTSSSYTLEVPDGFSFSTVFVDANTTEQVQKILDPANRETDLVKFTDLRGSTGGAFSIYAYMSDLAAGRSRTSITADNAGILSTHANSGSYSVDFDDNNYLSPDQETVTGPLDYNEEIGEGVIPAENYTLFEDADTGILIMDGTLGREESGRTGSYALAPALLINIPENTYGSFTGTVTFELVLS